jgi:hypothetical protein
MNPIQSMMNTLSEQWQKERSKSQMTLGKLIDRLESLPQEMMMNGITSPHSYRGYYTDLAFERGPRATVGETLTMLRGCMGEVFQGYKGGDYQMGRNTPVWVASYGECGPKIVAVSDDGSIQLQPDDI